MSQNKRQPTTTTWNGEKSSAGEFIEINHRSAYERSQCLTGSIVWGRNRDISHVHSIFSLNPLSVRATSWFVRLTRLKLETGRATILLHATFFGSSFSTRMIFPRYPHFDLLSRENWSLGGKTSDCPQLSRKHALTSAHSLAEARPRNRTATIE